ETTALTVSMRTILFILPSFPCGLPAPCGSVPRIPSGAASNGPNRPQAPEMRPRASSRPDSPCGCGDRSNEPGPETRAGPASGRLTRYSDAALRRPAVTDGLGSGGRVADRPDVRGDLAAGEGRWRARQRPD